jgi:hypothetical protein
VKRGPRHALIAPAGLLTWAEARYRQGWRHLVVTDGREAARIGLARDGGRTWPRRARLMAKIGYARVSTRGQNLIASSMSWPPTAAARSLPTR